MSTKTLFDAKAELAKMDLHAQARSTRARSLIAHYGCFALPRDSGLRGRQADRHGADRGGLQGRPPPRLRLHPHPAHAPGLVPTRSSTTPRIFDRDRARGWEEKLRMPNFRLSPRELDQVVTAVLGFQQLNAAPRVVKQLSPRRGGDRARPADRQEPQLPGLPRHRGLRRLVPLARRRHVARAADHPGRGREGAERLALLAS